MKQLSQLYHSSFLVRLLRLVDVFTSIATASSHPLSMVQRVANPYHLSSLFNLLLLVQPDLKIKILKILTNITKIGLPFEVFEEAVNVQTRNSKSMGYRMINAVHPQLKFESSQFITFLYNYLLNLRQ
jgi:hypothetical protein